MSDSSSEEFIRGEFDGSLKDLRDNFNKAPVAIIWPGGGFGSRPVQIAREYGYRLGFTVNPRGPVMYNWVPLADQADPGRPAFLAEGYVNDPPMVLPRYWPSQVLSNLDAVRIMGEEAALLEALEDKRGEPRNKPPFPTDHGLWGKPTLMNNVETFCAIPVILARGANWWAAQGKANYKGLKYMCVSGDVAKPGVYCVSWGTTVDELLTLCGGMRDGKALYAFSPGGASTNFLPASKRHVALDFKAMQEAGSSLGTGAMVFMAE